MRLHRTASVRGVLWTSSFIAMIGLLSLSLFGQSQKQGNANGDLTRIVLLKSGRMLNGQVERNAGGYLISQSNGQIQVPIEEVNFVVTDLHEAYQKQRDSVVEPTPATHLALANWCISYGLHSEAKEELKICLKSNPGHQEARRLLQRLVDTIREDQPPQADLPGPKKTAEGFLQPEAESLGGLSKEAAIMFTSRVQPILLNKCGNASCHGTTASNQFKIVSSRISGHSSRQNSERNLATVLKFINNDEGAESRLLAALRGAHGGRGPVFTGNGAQEQTKLVRNWVMSVAHERQTAREEQEQYASFHSPTRSKRRVQQAGAKSSRRGDAKLVVPALKTTDQPHGDEDEVAEIPCKLPPDPTDASELAAEPDDAFDPEQFNQRFQ